MGNNMEGKEKGGKRQWDNGTKGWVYITKSQQGVLFSMEATDVHADNTNLSPLFGCSIVSFLSISIRYCCQDL